MDPFTAMMLAQTGGGLIKGIGSYLGGGADRKKKEQLWQLLRTSYNQPGISQQQIQGFIPQMQASLTPMLNRLGQKMSTRVGLDSGAGQGEIARQTYGGLQGMLGDVKQRAMFTNAQRQQELLRLMTMMAG